MLIRVFSQGGPSILTSFDRLTCAGMKFRIAVLFLAAAAILPAQSGAGTIQGTVQDATSAAIPGSSVKVANQATGVVIETTANADGFYAVKGLFAGSYKVTFGAPGMKKSEASITLQNGQVLVYNAQLTVGEVSEKVTVSGETIQLATYDSGTVNTQLDAARISQLPQNGRNVLGLAQNTVPGLEGGGTRANGLNAGRHGILTGRRTDDQPQFRR